MGADRMGPTNFRVISSAEELLKERNMTREEWNEQITEQVKLIEADDSLTPEERDQKISLLLLMTITKDNRFLLEELLDEEAGGAGDG